MYLRGNLFLTLIKLKKMYQKTIFGADWLRGGGTHCTACDGSREETAFLTCSAKKGGVAVWQS